MQRHSILHANNGEFITTKKVGAQHMPSTYSQQSNVLTKELLLSLLHLRELKLCEASLNKKVIPCEALLHI